MTPGAPAGYGLVRGGTRGRKHLSFRIILVRMTPVAAVVLPLFPMFRQVVLIDTVAGLVLAYLTFDPPLAVWLLSAFFADVP
ncbi:multiple sugar transport system permease protein [Actinopolyspora xinjiangensis]|uniref:Multiple sugar transport system permease protein n=2 Tax=Actinopolyspora xinjiangensis TaxID=405564 RepID=A0A1H0TU23_9ACTN|nr:multiple sugar transport system permease protein [Actinopolyspora xinjiangensis]